MKAFLLICMVIAISSVAYASPNAVTIDLRTNDISECKTTFRHVLLPLVDAVLELLPALGQLLDALGEVPFKGLLDYIQTNPQSSVPMKFLAMIGYTVVMHKQPVLQYSKEFVSDQVKIVLDQLCVLAIENQDNLLPSEPKDHEYVPSY